MAVVWLFGGATGVFVAAYLWLLFATGLVVRAPWMQHLDVGMLGAGIAITIVVLAREGVLQTRRARLAGGVLVVALATVLSRAMLWVALRVDESLLYAMAAARDSSVQALGLTPTSYTLVSTIAFFAVGAAMAAVIAWLPLSDARG